MIYSRLSIPTPRSRYFKAQIDRLYDLAHVAGWQWCNLHDLAHVLPGLDLHYAAWVIAGWVGVGWQSQDSAGTLWCEAAVSTSTAAVSPRGVVDPISMTAGNAISSLDAPSKGHNISSYSITDHLCSISISWAPALLWCDKRGGTSCPSVLSGVTAAPTSAVAVIAVISATLTPSSARSVIAVISRRGFHSSSKTCNRRCCCCCYLPRSYWCYHFHDVLFLFLDRCFYGSFEVPRPLFLRGVRGSSRAVVFSALFYCLRHRFRLGPHFHL